MVNQESRPELGRLRRLLRETARLAEHASLTESMAGAASSAANQYNSVLRHVEQVGIAPQGLFQVLDPSSSFDAVGVASAQLAAYLEEDEEPAANRGGGGDNVHVNIGNFGGLKDLQGLGDVIRQHLPEWLGGQASDKPQDAQAEPAVETPQGLTEIESRLAEVGAKLQAIAEQLRRGDLGDEQRAELADQLSRCGQEQARLARAHAMLRERTPS